MVEYNTSAKGPNKVLMERIKQANEQANLLLASELPIPSDKAALRTIIAKYVQIRYLLTDEDMQVTEHFNGLGEISLSRGLGLPVEVIRTSELDAKCQGTSSAMSKKILLVIALNKLLGITIDATTTADITTVTQLAHEVAWALEKGESGAA